MGTDMTYESVNSMVNSVMFMGGVVHAWVGQILLNCNVFKR